MYVWFYSKCYSKSPIFPLFFYINILFHFKKVTLQKQRFLLDVSLISHSFIRETSTSPFTTSKQHSVTLLQIYWDCPCRVERWLEDGSVSLTVCSLSLTVCVCVCVCVCDRLNQNDAGMKEIKRKREFACCQAAWLQWADGLRLRWEWNRKLKLD